MIKFLKNSFLITVPSLFAFAIFLEVVAQFFLPTSDFPDVLFHPLYGNQFVPNQTGVFIRGANQQIRAKYRINNQGWNSPYDYHPEKSPGLYRIATVGDSFVEALQVDYDQSFTYLLEDRLNQKNPVKKFQTYSFGQTGANLMQNLAVFKNISKVYKPDVAIIVLIHNDFLESFEGFGRVDHYTLRQQGNRFDAIRPHPASTMSIKRILRKSALVRYLLLNQQVLERYRFIRSWIPGNKGKKDAKVSLEKAKSFSRENYLNMLSFLFEEFKKAAKLSNTKLLFVMNTARFPSQVEAQGAETSIARFNDYSRQTAERLGLEFLDLTRVFQESWDKEGQPHVWEIDNHWNQKGHQMVADALNQRLEKLLVTPVGGK